MEKSKYFENINSLKLMAKHEVGQNFLIDYNVAEKIVSLLDCKENERILEIGSGAGSLSYFLANGPAKSDLIDIDEGLVIKLQNDFKNNQFVNPTVGNAMRFDYATYEKIIGNLPYYITSGIIERALLLGQKAKRMVFMVQKEAGERILAPFNSKDYSPLSVLISLTYDAKKAFNVDRSCFAPAPHVDSSVLVFDLKEGADKEEAAKAYTLALALFKQRRKTIANNLKSYLGSKEKSDQILSLSGINPTKRPENISPLEYVRLTKLLNK